MDKTIRLTQFSPGAGCGCKIAPNELEKILKGSKSQHIYEHLLVGNESKDDAAVFDIGDGKAIISTTDFFTPIVDDPYDFGRIAATNAISDIYAMGGSPVMAIAILGWPLDKLPAELATDVISGARAVCDKAGIPLAGGHSINISEPIFGLAVTGVAATQAIRKNSGATSSCKLFLTKPLGIGLITTAEKFGIAKPEQKERALRLMTTLNNIGAPLAQIEGIKSITDVTGFGLLGHALEMAEGSNLDIVIDYAKIPRIEGVEYYIENETIPGGTNRNFASYGAQITPMTPEQKALLCDPQTSGGLLVAAEPQSIEQIKAMAQREGVLMQEIGYFKERGSIENDIRIHIS